MIQVLWMALMMSALSWGSELKVLSWNVYMLPKPLKNSRQKERTQLIARELKKLDHDVIVLQEAFSENFRNVVSATLGLTHPYHLRLPKSGAFKQVMCSGLMILSRRPIKLVDYSYYETCAGADCFASKGVLLAEVGGSPTKIQLAVTHMQASNDDVHEQIRHDQTLMVSNLLRYHARAGTPQILAGDLNVDSRRGHEFPAMLATLGLSAQGQDLMESSKALATSCFIKRESTKLARIDHVLSHPRDLESFAIQTSVTPIRAELNSRLCDLSDHHPLSSKISF